MTGDELPIEREDGKNGEILPPAKEPRQKLVTRAVHYPGPLPPASEFRQYDEILPGAAERILLMAETEQKHRLQMQDKIIDAGIKTEQRGQIIAALLVITFSGVAIGLFIAKQYAYAVAVMGLIAGMASVFIYKGNWKAQQDERRQEKEEPSTTE